MEHKHFIWIILYTLQICQAQSTSNSGNLPAGAIIGIIFGGLIVLVAISVVAGVCLKMKWRQRRKRETKEKTPTNSPKIITDTLVERLPDIPEEDENIRQSSLSEREESHVTFQSIQPEADTIPQLGVNYETRMDVDNEKERDFVTEIISEMSDLLGQHDMENAPNQVNEKKIEKEFAADVKINIDNGPTEYENEGILITRVVENENVLRKDIPHLNSTENIFLEYDAAMKYQTESFEISKSDVSLNINYLNCSSKPNEQAPFEFTRDDSELNLKSESKLEAEKDFILSDNSCKSEGNLTDAVKRKSLKRRSSLISKITSKSFAWNFDYISPYSMSEKQKAESLKRKIRMQKRKSELEKQKQVENEKRQNENSVAFIKWKLQKKKQSLRKSNEVDNVSIGSMKLKRYRYWYPY